MGSLIFGLVHTYAVDGWLTKNSVLFASVIFLARTTDV